MDYSDYIQHRSNLSNGLSLLSGFVFTAITILLTQLPDPSTLQSQAILLFLTVLFNLYSLLLFWLSLSTARLCKNLPPLTKGIAAFNLVASIGVNFLGLAPILMFFLWNLIYLTLASGISYALFTISSYFFVLKPMLEDRKQASRHK